MPKFTYRIDIDGLLAEFKLSKKKNNRVQPVSFSKPGIAKGLIVEDLKRPPTPLRCWWDHHPLMLEGLIEEPFGTGLPEAPTVSYFLGCPVRVKKERPKKYETVGMFCSYECTKAFIKVHSKEPKYRNAMGLLQEMFEKDYPEESFEDLKIPKDFEVLESYEGHKSIESFRRKFHFKN